VTAELLDAALCRLRRLAGSAPDPRDDRGLLRLFACQRSESAFAELVARHGPMVLGVCRRVLGHEQDAEDAFQAAFLVLAKKAGSVGWQPSVAAWLHEVACRVAREARARRRREVPLPVPLPHEEREAMDESERREREGLVDEEVRGLPRRYREAVVLCYLEGLGREQAAQRLGWSVRTLDRRLARARELLRARLTRRGLAPEGTPGSLPVWVIAPAVPSALSESAVRGAASFAFGGGVDYGSASVLALARSVLGSMAAARVKVLALIALVLGLAVAGAGTMAWPRPDKGPAEAGRPSPSPTPRTDRHGDPLPAGAVARLGTVRFRHPGWRKKILFSPDGKTLLTRAESNSLRIWDPTTGKLLGKIDTDDSTFSAVALSPDGKTLASAGQVKAAHGFLDHPVIRFWDVATRKAVRTLDLKKDDRVERLAFSPNGEYLLGSGQGVRVWEVKTGTEILRYKLGGRAGFLALSPDGKIVAGADRDKLYLWEWQTEKKPRVIEGLSRQPLALAFSPDGRTLAGSFDVASNNPVRLWDVATGRVKLRLNDERLYYSSRLAFSPDGKTLATTDQGNRAGKGWSGGVNLWDAATGKLVREFPTPGESADDVCFSADGRWLAAGTSAGAHVWEVKTGREVGPGDTGHRGHLGSLSASAGRIATASDDHTVRLWDAETGKYLRALRHGHWVRSAALSPDGSKLASSSLDDHVYLWDAHTGKVIYKLPGHGRLGGRRLVSFTADGKRFLSFGDDFYLRVWEVATGKALVEHRLRPKGVPIPDEDADPSEREKMLLLRSSPDASAASPDGKTFVVAVGRQFHVFDVASGKERQTLDNPGGMVMSLAVSPDGKHLLTSSSGRGVEKKLPDGRVWFTSAKDHPICLWDLSTGKLLRKTVLPKGGAGPVAFSPDGKTYALCVHRPRVKITLYETASGKERRSFDRVGSRVWSLAFSPDGKKLITGMNDTSALVWDLTTGGTSP
jgi:RNA polymerase sigma factor (sigma-70 family)